VVARSVATSHQINVQTTALSGAPMHEPVVHAVEQILDVTL
jgi:hypothetical protein